MNIVLAPQACIPHMGDMDGDTIIKQLHYDGLCPLTEKHPRVYGCFIDCSNCVERLPGNMIASRERPILYDADALETYLTDQQTLNLNDTTRPGGMWNCVLCENPISIRETLMDGLTISGIGTGNAYSSVKRIPIAELRQEVTFPQLDTVDETIRRRRTLLHAEVKNRIEATKKIKELEARAKKAEAETAQAQAETARLKSHMTNIIMNFDVSKKNVYASLTHEQIAAIIMLTLPPAPAAVGVDVGGVCGKRAHED